MIFLKVFWEKVFIKETLKINFQYLKKKLNKIFFLKVFITSEIHLKNTIIGF